MVGDAGYVKPDSFKDDLNNRYRVKLVHPYRSNQISKQDKLIIAAAKLDNRLKVRTAKLEAKTTKMCDDIFKSKNDKLQDLKKPMKTEQKFEKQN